MISQMIADVTAFHKVFGHPVLPKPDIPDPQRQFLRMKLFRDEYVKEFVPAWDKCAEASKAKLETATNLPLLKAKVLAEFGDVIADLIYYLIGASLEYGIPLQEVWDTVQKANMSKLWTHDEVTAAIQGDQNKAIHWRFIKTDVLGERGETQYVAYDETGKVMKPPSWKDPQDELIALIQGRMA